MATETPEPLAVLLELPESTLRSLAEAFASGPLKHGISTQILVPFVGMRSGEFALLFNELLESGISTPAIGRICRAFAAGRAMIDSTDQDLYLTLSGPEVNGTPVVDTATVVKALFNEAKTDVILTSYVISHARELLSPLSEKHDADDSFRVRIITDLSHQRKYPDEPLLVVANRFRVHFLDQHWTGRRPPELWHDPRVFKPEPGIKPGVMHAKVVIIDKTAALISSANFTEAALNRNIETGVLLRQPRQVLRLRSFFEGLMIEKGLIQI